MEIIGVLLLLIATGWVYRDAKDRGSDSPVGWAIGTFLLLIVFLPLYLIRRPTKNKSLKLCHHCGKYYDGTPSFCSHCGKSLNE